MNATLESNICISRNNGGARHAPSLTARESVPDLGENLATQGGAAPVQGSPSEIQIHQSGFDGENLEVTPQFIDEPDIETPCEHEPDPVFEHGACCNCEECYEKALHRRRLAVLKESKLLFHKRFPAARFYGDSDCKLSHDVWSDLDLQLNHFRCFSEEKRHLLETVYRKVNYDLEDGERGYWKNQTLWKNYDSTASIIACSRYEKQREFAGCGLNGFSCGNRSFCLRCCFNLLAEPALAEFGNSFSKDNEVYFVVLSLSRRRDETARLIFTDLTKSEIEQIKINGTLEQGPLDNYGIKFEELEEVYEAQVYWELFGGAMRGFIGRNKPFSGAFGGPELSARYYPVGALPHANYIAWSQHLCAADVRELRRIIRQKMRACRRITPGVYPKVAVYRILSSADLRSVIKYIFKPIDFTTPYALTAKKLVCDPKAMSRLNNQVNTFLENATYAFWGIHRMSRFGICSPVSKHYIGNVTPQRKGRRKKDRERRKQERKERKGIRKMFPEYRPHRRRPSEQERKDAFLMRVYYRRFVLSGELPEKIPQRWLRRFARATNPALNNA